MGSSDGELVVSRTDGELIFKGELRTLQSRNSHKRECAFSVEQ